MVSGLSSSAALCEVTVSKALSKEDCIADLLLNQLVSKYQIQVTIRSPSNRNSTTDKSSSSGTTTPSKNNVDMELFHPPSGLRLFQRDSIMRALAGPLLHYSLDLVLLGGHGAVAFGPATTTSTISKSIPSVLAMAQITLWMKRANQIRSSTSAAITQDMVNDIKQQLDATLEQQAFLVESSSCSTLADYDMVAAIGKQINQSIENTPIMIAIFQSNAIQRWYTTVYYQLQELGANLLNCYTPPSFDSTIPQFLYTLSNPIDSTLSKVESKVFPKTTKSNSDASPTSTTTAKNSAKQVKSKESSTQPQSSNVSSTKMTVTKPPTPTTNITVLDIRIGYIQKAWEHPTADSLLCELIDVGEEQPRSIASGLRAYYSPEDLVGKYVLVVCNLKPRAMMGFTSHGMVLCASKNHVDASTTHSKQVELMIVESSRDATSITVPIGTRIAFGNLEGLPESESKVAKKKLAEQVLPFLQTNHEGYLLWKGDAGPNCANTTSTASTMTSITTDGHLARVPDTNEETGKECLSSPYVIRALNCMPNAQVG
jgi:aminoacyl tRNA synthase complex-interacting multifunctional protein 1